MMFGFSRRRLQLLEAELFRIAGELPALGARGTLLVHELHPESIRPDTELDLVVILESTEPFHRRADFLVSHLRPRVGVNFFVYTPEEYEAYRSDDRLVLQALESGRVIDEPA